jgi:dihydropyrimidine dehydrogenase (NAD+) subunit PreA
MVPSLAVDFAGIQFPNPFMLSSAPPTTTPEMIGRAFEAGWGGAVIKTLAYDLDLVRNVDPRIHGVHLEGRVIGFSNIELGSNRPVDLWIEDIRRLKKQYPDNVLLASLLHTEGLVREQWIEVAGRCSEAGIDGLELNFSCSHGMAEGGGGAVVGGSPELIRRVLGWVREATEKPVFVKLPAGIENLPQKAQAAKQSGASAISAINTLNCLPGIDIYTFTPYPSVAGKGAFGGLSGTAIKPIGLRCVAQIAQQVQIPISGIGGIGTWQDAVEYFLVGASTVQVCSAVMRAGYRIVEDLSEGLLDYMEKMGFREINDFVGLALKNIVKHNLLSRDYKLVSAVNLDTCTRCGLCAIVCRDSAYQAIELDQDRVPVIDQKQCEGCGLCVQICPVPDCMRLQEKQT